MRPKKKILLVCSTELTLSDLTVKLKVWGYEVDGADSLDLALDSVREKPFDLVILVSHPDPRTWNLFTRMALDIDDIQMHRGSVALVMDPSQILPHEIAMGVSRIYGRGPSCEYLRIAIRLAVGRQRGPRAQIAEKYRPSRRVA